MKALLNLKQRTTVEEYQREFQELVYKATMLNHHYDEHMFIAHFIRGLKPDIRAAVESQVLETLERAYLLARVQQEVWEENRHGTGQHKTPLAGRQEIQAPPKDTLRPSLKIGSGDYWKDRQLRDYRRANHLCFKCGEKYDPTHQCPKKMGELHAIQTEQMAEQLSDEILNMMELQDIAEAE